MESANDNYDCNINIATGTLNVTANINMGATTARNNLNLTGAGILNIGGNITGGGALTLSGIGSTVNFNGVAQTINATAYDNLTVSGSSTKTLGGAVLVNAALAVSAGTLELNTNNLTVNGTTSITGTLSDNSVTGTNIFAGLVTINAGGIWNNSGNSPVTFRGGITKNPSGTFTAGTGVHTFNTNAQSLTGTFSIPSVTVSGTTLTNNNQLTVSTSLAGGGTLTQGVGARLNIDGTAAISTLTATANPDTVDYSGGAQTVHGTSTYNTLILSNERQQVIDGRHNNHYRGFESDRHSNNINNNRSCNKRQVVNRRWHVIHGRGLSLDSIRPDNSRCRYKRNTCYIIICRHENLFGSCDSQCRRYMEQLRERRS